jgi:hypothetical protein
MGIRNFAHNHPIISGAIAGSIVPGIGTVTGALIGLGYAVVTEKKPSGLIWQPLYWWQQQWWQGKMIRLTAIGATIVAWLGAWATWWIYY